MIFESKIKVLFFPFDTEPPAETTKTTTNNLRYNRNRRKKAKKVGRNTYFSQPPATRTSSRRSKNPRALVHLSAFCLPRVDHAARGKP